MVKLLAICLVLVLLGLVVIGWALPWAKASIGRLDPERGLLGINVALVLMFLSIIPIALYIWGFGRKVIRLERFPPPGVKVIRDTKLILGPKARARGRMLIVLSVLLLIFSLVGALYTHYMFGKMITNSHPPMSAR